MTRSVAPVVTDVPDFLTTQEFFQWGPAGRYHERWHLLDGLPVQMPTLPIEQSVLHKEIAWVIAAHLHHQESDARVGTKVALTPAGSDRNIYVACVGVTCEPKRPTRFVHKPVVIAEIVNPQNYKLVHVGVAMCKLIPSLQEIVVLDGLHVCAAIHRRKERGEWDEPDYVFRDETLELRSLRVQVPLNRLYQCVDLAAQQVMDDPGEPDYWTEPAR